MPLDRAAAIRCLLARFPMADEIRFSGKCPSCKQQTEYSFQLPGDGPRGDGKEEACGYFCVNCKWGNSGSRKSIDVDEIEQEELL